jgi:uncharacterized protein (DUF2164 family)
VHLSKDDRADAVVRIQRYFRDERGEALGDLAAGMLLDFIQTELAPAFYNQGVKDAKAVATRFSGLLDEEIDALRMLAAKTKASR